MRVCQCKNGHLFDRDVCALCPRCGEGPVEREGESPDTRRDAKEQLPAPVYAGPPAGGEKQGQRRSLLARFKSAFPGSRTSGEAFRTGCVYAGPPVEDGRTDEARPAGTFPESRTSGEAPPTGCVYAGPPADIERTHRG